MEDVREILNYTRHALDIYDENGVFVTKLQPSGLVARAEINQEKVGKFQGISIFHTTFVAPNDQPPPKPGTLYVVSRAFLLAVREHRGDMFQPGELMRDHNHKVVGCVGIRR